MFFLIIIASFALVATFHALLMRAVNGYEYGDSPTTEWRKFEAEKVGSYHIF